MRVSGSDAGAREGRETRGVRFATAVAAVPDASTPGAPTSTSAPNRAQGARNQSRRDTLRGIDMRAGDLHIALRQGPGRYVTRNRIQELRVIRSNPLLALPRPCPSPPRQGCASRRAVTKGTRVHLLPAIARHVARRPALRLQHPGRADL